MRGFSKNEKPIKRKALKLQLWTGLWVHVINGHETDRILGGTVMVPRLIPVPKGKPLPLGPLWAPPSGWVPFRSFWELV